MRRKIGLIYINGRFLTKSVIGVQRFAVELLNSLDYIMGDDKEASHKFKIICLIPSDTQNDRIPNWKNIQIKRVGCLHGDLWEQGELPFYASKGLLIDLCNIGPILHFNQIIVFHDASTFAIPNAYSKAFRLKYRIVFWVLAHTARQILTVSQFSKDELAYYLKFNTDRIQVIPEGCEHILNTVPDLSILNDERLIDKPFLLAVGSSSLHKNLASVIDAIESIKDNSISLVIAGGNFSRVFNSIKQTESQRVIYLGFVTDAELRALYSKAVGFIFPSLYEGFGIPPLEAMVCGCPVLCSNKASIPEVCGDAALYFNPMNVPEIANQISRLVNDPLLQDSLRQRGFERAKQFTWEKAAFRFQKILQNNFNLNQ